MNYLYKGSQSQERLDALLSFDKSTSEDIKAALSDYLVRGISKTNAATLNGVKGPNFTRALKRLEVVAGKFENALEIVDQKIEEDVLALALNMAKLMLKTKINVDPAIILPVVRDAIHYLPNVQKPARIIVHHEDARILRDLLGEELAEQAWQIQEDHNIERGGCLVETGENQIDASNEMRWKRISDALVQNNAWLLP